MSKPRIAKIFKTPVKGLEQVSVDAISFDLDGPLDDHCYAIIRASGKVVTLREEPTLALLRVELDSGHVTITPPPGSEFGTIRLHSYSELSHQRTAIIHGEPVTGYTISSLANAFFTAYLGEPCEVVKYSSHTPRIRTGRGSGQPLRTRFTDGYPVTFMSSSSLVPLNRILHGANESAVSAQNFRPTFVVENCHAHDEDFWMHASLSRADRSTVRFRFEKHCERCIVPDVDLRTGSVNRKHRPVTEALRTYRKIHEGSQDVYFTSSYAIDHLDPSTVVRVGDELDITYQPDRAAA